MGGPTQTVLSVLPDTTRPASSVATNCITNVMMTTSSTLNEENVNYNDMVQNDISKPIDDKAYASSNMGGQKNSFKSWYTGYHKYLQPKVETVIDPVEQEQDKKAPYQKWLPENQENEKL